MLKSKKFKMDEQLLDTLISFSDFQNFKEMMLNYKHSKNNKTTQCVPTAPSRHSHQRFRAWE